MRRFTCALQTNHHNDRRGLGCDLKLRRFSAHKRDQLFINDLNDLLCGQKAFKHRFTDSAFCNAFYKFLNDLKINVRLKKRKLYLTHPLFHVRLGKLSFAAKPL